VDRVSEPTIFPANSLYCVNMFYDPEVIRDEPLSTNCAFAWSGSMAATMLDARKLDKASMA
jgi:hypothetical protein